MGHACIAQRQQPALVRATHVSPTAICSLDGQDFRSGHDRGFLKALGDTCVARTLVLQMPACSPL